MNPQFVTQHTVLSELGLLPRRFLRLARRGAFPSTKVDRDVVARRADVSAFIEARIQLAERRPVNDTDPEAVVLARVGARRVAR
jgi:hypothetical protein